MRPKPKFPLVRPPTVFKHSQKRCPQIAPIQAEVKEKDLALIHKDEEIKNLKARSQIVVKSAEDIKTATASQVKKVKKAAAADLAMTQSAMANLTAAAAQQKREYKDQTKEARRSLRAASRRIEAITTAHGENERLKVLTAALEQERDNSDARAAAAEDRLGAYAEQVATLETELQLAREGHAELHANHVELSDGLEKAHEALEEAQVHH
jgi:chromosome segregation ATPase